jgi:hypothetical protein
MIRAKLSSRNDARVEFGVREFQRRRLSENAE